MSAKQPRPSRPGGDIDEGAEPKTPQAPGRSAPSSPPRRAYGVAGYWDAGDRCPAGGMLSGMLGPSWRSETAARGLEWCRACTAALPCGVPIVDFIIRGRGRGRELYVQALRTAGVTAPGAAGQRAPAPSIRCSASTTRCADSSTRHLSHSCTIRKYLKIGTYIRLRYGQNTRQNS